MQRWNLLADFKALLERSLNAKEAHPSWAERNRKLAVADYLSLFLFGLLNPTVRTMRGLCAASALPRVQRDVCSRGVSLGSFSAAQHVLDPELLRKVFDELSERCGAKGARPQSPRWLIRDSTVWEALPRMHWAFWRAQGRTQGAVRLHLSLHVLEDAPAGAQITAGSVCERKAWKETWQSGDAYIGDRYFGEDYSLLNLLAEKGCSYVIRLREKACIKIEEQLPISAAEQAKGILRDAWVTLGHERSKVHPRVRLVWVQGPEEVLILATNTNAADLSAAVVSDLYRQRWQVELFFRWIKCILGCRHWLAESPAGVAAQIYLSLIAALLLQLYAGQRPTLRMMELIQFYHQGVATLDDLTKGLERERAKAAAKKKK